MTRMRGTNGDGGGKGVARLNADAPEFPAVRVLPKGGELEREIATSVLLGDDRGVPVLENIRAQASMPHRGAQWATLYAEIVGWRGTKEQVIAYVVSQLGCPVDEAREAVQQLERAPKDPHEIYATCRAYCDWYEATMTGGDA